MSQFTRVCVGLMANCDFTGRTHIILIASSVFVCVCVCVCVSEFWHCVPVGKVNSCLRRNRPSPLLGWNVRTEVVPNSI